MRCKIDNGLLEHKGQDGYTDKWRCRKCKVWWFLEPRGDIDTDGKVIAELIKAKSGEVIKPKKNWSCEGDYNDKF